MGDSKIMLIKGSTMKRCSSVEGEGIKPIGWDDEIVTLSNGDKITGKEYDERYGHPSRSYIWYEPYSCDMLLAEYNKIKPKEVKNIIYKNIKHMNINNKLKLF
jgi:hypothetical protein